MTELKMKALKTSNHDDHQGASEDDDDIFVSTATRVKDGVNLLDALDRLGFVQRPSAGRRIGVGVTGATGLGTSTSLLRGMRRMWNAHSF